MVDVRDRRHGEWPRLNRVGRDEDPPSFVRHRRSTTYSRCRRLRTAHPGNDALDVGTAVRARRADFVAGYVPASGSITWLNDATQRSHGDPVATAADPTAAFVGITGGGPGGPFTISERPCGAPFSCAALHRTSGGSYPTRRRLRQPYPGERAERLRRLEPARRYLPRRLVGRRDRLGSLKVSFQNGSIGMPSVLASCGGWNRSGPPCVSSIGRSFQWCNHYCVRRPPHRRAIHQRWNVRARPIGRARHRREDRSPYRPGASRLPVSFVTVAVGAADVSGRMAPAAPARCLPPGLAPRRGPRARQTATVVAPRPKTAAAA